jgi:ankyrin repeat protein
MTRKKVFLVLAVACISLLNGCSSAPKTVVRDEFMVCMKQSDLKLVVAALMRDQPGIEAAVQNGADVNVTIEGLGPPLVFAALTDNHKAVQLLLDKGADINTSDSHGYTALLNASFSNNSDIVQLLLARGADVNMSSEITTNGKKARVTPLMMAKSKGHQTVIKLLTDAGAKDE